MLALIAAEVLQLVITTFVAAIVGAVASQIYAATSKHVNNSASEVHALKEGMRSLLRNELIAAHREYVEQLGSITLESLEYIEETYNAYHGLGGNGSGTKLWEDIKALPIKH